MNSVVQKLLQEKLSAQYSSIFFQYIILSTRWMRCKVLRGREEHAEAVSDTGMENNKYMIRRTAKTTPTADSVLNIYKILKANPETNVASWPIFITCSSLLAQDFPSNNFGDPVKSLPPPSVPYFMTAP